jgi:hypothetical protein
MQSTCPNCQTNFTARVGAKPQRYCSTSCRRAVQNARARAGEQRTHAAGAISAGSNVLAPVLTAYAPARTALEMEWLECWPDLHRAVAGRMNKTASTHREDAAGNDRQPIGHAVFVDGHWIGRVRQRGAEVWTSERLGSVEEAKAAVEAHLAGMPELVAANLNRPEPERLAA